MMNRLRRWGPGAAIVLLTMLVYVPVWRAGFVWNDKDLDYHLGLIERKGLEAIWFSTEPVNYWPVTWTSYWIEHEIFGDDPASGRPRPVSYHVVNVVVHGLASLLLWQILLRLHIRGAWLAALVFAVHPVNVESVAWVTQRKSVLCLFFYLAAVRSWLDFEQHGGRVRYAGSLICFLLGMLSKGAVIACPLVLLLLAWWQRGRVTRQDIVRAMPFLAIAVLMGISEIWFQDVRAIGNETIRNAGLAERILATGPICWFYLSKAVFPIELSFVYPLWTFDVTSVINWVPLIVLLATIGLLFQARGRISRAVLVALLYYLLCLGPVMGLLDIFFMKYSLVADHYQYVALPGLVALLIGGGTRWARRGGIGDVSRHILAVGLLTVLAVLTWRQQLIYHDEESLWRDVISKNPRASIAYNNLGNLRLERGNAQEAVALFESALEITPDAYDTHYNLGLARQSQGRLEDAIVQYQRSLQIKADNATAHNNLGVVLRQRGRPDQAIDHYRRAVRIDGDFAEAHINLGVALATQGRLDDAIECFGHALRIKPHLVEVHTNLGNALLAVGRLDEAIGRYRRALEIRPDDARTHFNLGGALVHAGRVDEAIHHFRRALTINPDLTAARVNIDTLLKMQHRP